MVENKSSLFGIIAIIIGASGLGIGVFSVVNFQVVEGPQGLLGEDGQDGINGIDGINGKDGQDASEGIVVGILEPDEGEIISGNVTIRAMIVGTTHYITSVLRNGTEIGTSVPMVWNTSTVSNGYWNITIIITDIESNKTGRDEVIVYKDSSPVSGYTRTYYFIDDTDYLTLSMGYFEAVWSYNYPIYMDVEEGEIVHLTFSATVYSEIGDIDVEFAFFDMNAGQLGSSAFVSLTGTNKAIIHFERIVTLPIVAYQRRITVMANTFSSVRTYNKFLIAQTLIP